MSLSTNLISGLASGFDWRSTIDELIKIERRPVDLVEKQKGEYEEKLSAWRSFNTDLLSLKTAAGSLTLPEHFHLYTSQMSTNSSTVDASDLLSVSTTSSAQKGSYEVEVNQLAKAQKLSSRVFNSYDEALGYEGDILINGTVVAIAATDDLAAVRDKINNVNSGENPTGLTASIVTYASNDYRLVLTSDDTGEDGMSLQNGSAADLVQSFGWKDKTGSLKHQITGGAQTDTFASTTQEIKSLLGLSTTQSGTIQVAGTDVDIDLSADTLEEIKNKIDAVAGVSASIVTTSSDGVTQYKIQVDGTQEFTDDQNILETLGVLEHGVGEVQGTTSGNTMTSNGENITADTLLVDIDGYHTWTTGDHIDISGTDHSNNGVNETFTITSSSTVGDLVSAIESAFEADGDDVEVYVTSDGKIQVADQETGTSDLSVGLSSVIADPDSELDWGTFSDLTVVRERELVAGREATITIDGVEVTSSDNKVEDVIPGVTLDLKKADEATTVTLDIDRDLDAVMEKINSFVDAYNKVAEFIAKQQEYDEETEETGGVLFGDNTLTSVKSQLTSVLTERVWGVASEFSTLGLVGINVDKDGQLNVDEEELRGHLETNFNDVMKLFSAYGSTSTGEMEYISYGRETQEGEYTVNITQAATRSSSTSDTAVSGTLGGDETITITQDGKTAEIALTSDMTISGIVNAINAELDTAYTEKHVGSEAVTAGGSAITSSTTWAEIDGADLVDGDVISFSGTKRNGSTVSGSYTISDTGTDTIQGLLSEIESAFGSEVVASIDSSGRLVITDKQEGNSRLSLSLDYSETENGEEIFGTVSTENPGGQEGRWAMDITASNDGSDHLVLTHESYGSGKSFTISETNDLLWTEGDQTVDNGLDVAGTINGEAATGSGRTLTGADGETNVDGLVVKYTGTDTGEVGTVKLTLGAAELFDRALYNITDPYDGYVSFKQDSIENTIDRLDTRMEEMEDRINRKMEMMINRFVAMERAIQKIQSQSQWLSGQINSLYGQ
ncbi:MAG: flagellar filament capping protein FliD [Desulfobacteraceae bacterium]